MAEFIQYITAINGTIMHGYTWHRLPINSTLLFWNQNWLKVTKI